MNTNIPAAAAASPVGICRLDLRNQAWRRSGGQLIILTERITLTFNPLRQHCRLTARCDDDQNCEAVPEQIKAFIAKQGFF